MNELGFIVSIDFDASDKKSGETVKVCYFDASMGSKSFDLTHLDAWHDNEFCQIVADDILYVEGLKSGICCIGEVGIFLRPDIRPNSLKIHDEYELAKHVIDAIKEYVKCHEKESDSNNEKIFVRLKWDKTISTFIEVRNFENLKQ